MEKSKLLEKIESMNEDIKDKPPKSLSLPDMLNDSHIYLHPKSDKCVFNEYGQCIKGFRYFCAYCNYGVGGMFTSCYNSKCYIPKCDTLKSDEKQISKTY